MAQGVEMAADYYLAALVETFGDAEEPLPITVLVGGAFISGELVGERSYFSTAGLPEKVKDQALAATADAGTPRYLHLRNVRTLQANGNLALFHLKADGLLGGALRIRLASVDAWWPGLVHAP